MSDSFQEAMKKLSQSRDLCDQTYSKVTAKMTVLSALEETKKAQDLPNKPDQLYQPQDLPKKPDQLYQPQDLPKKPDQLYQPQDLGRHQKDRPSIISSAKMSSIIDLGNFKKKKHKSKTATSTPLTLADFPIDEDEEDRMSVSTVSFYESTGIGSRSDAMSVASSSKNVFQISQRLGSKKLSRLDQAMKSMAYHMAQVSFECECHFQDVPLSAMTRADKRHCRRFHKGLIGKKKVGEKRSSLA